MNDTAPRIGDTAEDERRALRRAQKRAEKRARAAAASVVAAKSEASGKTVAIIAGGESATPEAAAEVRRRGWYCIVTNTSIRLAPWADVLFAADRAWWLKYKDEVAGFGGRRFHCQQYGQPLEAQYAKPRLCAMNGGGNSALHAAHLAQDEGAARLILIGVDLRPDRLTHWHGAHPVPLINATVHQFKAALGAWERCATGLLRTMQIINCSPDSAVTVFPKMRIEDVP